MSKPRRAIGVFDVLQFWPLVPVLPLALATAHRIRKPKAWSPAQTTLLGLAGAAVGLNLVRWQLQRFTVAQPRYEVVEHDGAFEVRRYPELVVAQTQVRAADFDEALDEGFTRLAGFIFGKNAQKAQVAMTSPVLTQPERLEMTSPVTTQQEAGGYTVSFMMPPERTVASLPTPDDARVVVRVQPPRTVASLCFRGRYDAEHVEKAKVRLLNGAVSRGLRLKGEPAFAGYDGPSTLPFLRRNEVWVEVA